jgi:hypothetical protein
MGRHFRRILGWNLYPDMRLEPIEPHWFGFSIEGTRKGTLYVRQRQWDGWPQDKPPAERVSPAVADDYGSPQVRIYHVESSEDARSDDADDRHPEL